MEVLIDGELTKLPDDEDLTIGELEAVTKYLELDIANPFPSQKLMGMVFIALRRKNPDGAIVDQVDAVRKMTVKSLGIKNEEVAAAFPLPDANLNGHPETTPEPSGHPA